MSYSSPPGQCVRRFLVDPEVDLAIHRLVAQLRYASGTSVDISTLTGALWAVALAAEAQLCHAARVSRIGPRPSNADPVGRQQYGLHWAVLVRQVLGSPSTVVRRTIGGASPANIAKELNLTPNHARVAKHRAAKRLGMLLGGAASRP